MVSALRSQPLHVLHGRPIARPPLGANLYKYTDSHNDSVAGNTPATSCNLPQSQQWQSAAVELLAQQAWCREVFGMI